MDVLIHECATSKGGSPGFSKEQVGKHRESKRTFPDEAGKIFSRVRPRLAVFSHIANDAQSSEEILRGAREHYKGPIVAGEDLIQIEISRDEIAVRKGGRLLELVGPK